MKFLLKGICLVSFFFICIYAVSYIFNIDSFIFTSMNINGDTYIKLDFWAYVNNFNGAFDKFIENISNLGTNHYNWDGFINTIKSLCNIVIAILNTALIPFSLIGSILNFVCALFGLAMNDTNVLYTIFNSLAALQIPFISF